MSVDERARAGLFLAMQYPGEVPGVSVSNFLRTAVTAVRPDAPKLRTWVKDLNGAFERLAIDSSFKERSVNEGFSGGERKRLEVLQLELLKPKLAILDETDSGLDVDALKVVSAGVNRVRETGTTGTLLITHYTRILRYIEPDYVHVFVGGRFVEEGGPELADRLEAEGYDTWVKGAGPAKVDDAAGVAGTPGRTTSRRSARTSRSSTGRSAPACRWSTWTTPRRARSRSRCSTRCATTTSSTTPTCTAASTPSPRRPRHSTKAPATRLPRSSTPPTAPRSSSR